MPNLCCLCDEPISVENDTKEHLIPNALGGRRKVSGFICRSCNSNTGETWDAELAKQLLPLSIMFNIKRERGNTPPLNVVTTAGEGLIVNPAQPLTIAKPSFEQTKLETGATQYQITARDMGEARRILTGLKRKHPEIDVDALLKNTTITETYPQGAIHHSLSIGGELAGRSIVKSCLAMAIASGISRENCSAALQYLRQEGGAPCFGYYNENDLLQDRVSGMPLHCLAVRADAQSGLVGVD